MHDIQNGDIQVNPGKTFKEYISEYQVNAEHSQIMRLVELFGLDSDKLKDIMDTNVNESNINDYGRFEELKDSVDKVKAKVYFEELERKTIPPFKVNMRVFNLLKEFILNDGMDL